jgi:hypothetical protein
MPKPRGGTSYRLSEEAQELLTRLAGRLGIPKTGVLEVAIRKLARSEFSGELILFEYNRAQRGRPKNPSRAPATGTSTSPQ